MYKIIKPTIQTQTYRMAYGDQASNQVYSYLYDHGDKNRKCEGKDPDDVFYPCGYATHASELNFEFRTGPSKG